MSLARKWARVISMSPIKVEKGLYYSGRMSITEQEEKDIDEFNKKVKENQEAGLPLDYQIGRAQLEKVAKFITPFEKVMEIFINEQRGRGNSEVTIKHYQQTMRKLEIFFCWLSVSKDEYNTMTKNQKISFGAQQPYAFMESDDFEANFREFLIEVEEVNEVTVATYFRDYRVMAYWLMENELIEKRRITIKNVESDPKAVYTDDEIDKLLKKPSDDCSFKKYRDWVVVNYVLGTGNRVGTIINLKISDIDFEENMISINTQKSKRKTRIPIEDLKLRKILKDYIEDWLTDENGSYVSTYLFPSSYSDASNYPMTRERMGRSIAEYNRSRGVNKTSIHLFRHTFVKNWILTGGDLHMLQKMLGHSTLEMVTHYANLYDVDLRQGVNNHSVLATHRAKNKGKMIKRRPKK